MKDQNQLFAIFALTLSLDIPLLEKFLLAIFETENRNLSNDNTSVVNTEEELQVALTNPEIKRIILNTDIILFSNLVFNRDIILDLNGYKLASLVSDARVIDIKCGDVMLTGRGSIVANGIGASAVRIKGAMTSDNASYSSLLVDEDVTLYAPNYFGLFITPNCQAAYGIEIVFKGSMIARDGFCINGSIQGTGENAPQLYLMDGARITVDENDGIAVYAPGYGCWNFGSAEIFGATGIGAKTGKFNFKDTVIVASGANDETCDWADGMTSSGAVFQLDTSKNNELQVTISSGEYTSRQSSVFIKNSNDEDESLRVKLQDGSFVGATEILRNFSSKNVKILKGNFSFSVDEFLSKDLHSEYDRSTRNYCVFGRIKSSNTPSPAEQLADSKAKLRTLIERAEFYLSENYSGQELGDLQIDVDRALVSLQRTKKSAEKLLAGNRITVEQIENNIKRLNKSFANIQKIEDELRTDIMSVIASAHAIDPHDYSQYSYQILMESVEDADILLIQKQVSLVDLYSAFCDVNMNLDLLDDPEEDEEFKPIEKYEPRAISQVLPNAEPTLAPEPEPELELEPEIEVEPDLESEIEDLDPEVELVDELNEAVIEDESDTEDTRFVLQLTTLLGSLALAGTSLPDPELEIARDNLRNLLDALTALSPNDYTVDSYQILHDIATSARCLTDEPDSEVSCDLLMATYMQVNDAYENLVKKPHNPLARALDEAHQNLSTMLEVVRDLQLSDYKTDSAEQFGELQVAIAKANASLKKSNPKLEEILEIMDEIQVATSGLKSTETELQPAIQTAPSAEKETIEAEPVVIVAPQPVANPAASSAPISPSPQIQNTLDWSALREVISDIANLNAAEYTADSYNHLLAQLDYVKKISNDPRLTQTMIEDIVFELNLSVLALVRIEAPADTSVYEDALLPNLEQENTDVKPNLLMSMMAGAYAGIATYRRSRSTAKQRK